MPKNTALRFKSGKGKSLRIDKLNAQKRKEVRNKFNQYKSISATILLFVVSLAFLASFFVYRNFNQHFASADSYQNYVSEYPTTTYFVVEDFNANPLVLKKLVFLTIDKANSQAHLFEIPVNEKLTFSPKYSDITLSELFMLGGVSTEDKITGGIDLVNTNLFKTFGFSIDNYILVDQSKEEVINNLLYKAKAVFPFGGLSPSSMTESFMTNYTLKDFYQFQKLLASISTDKIFVKSIDNDSLTSSASLDDSFVNMTVSSTISKEKKTVSVLNGTNISGIATLCGRVVNNIGGRVVAIENSSISYDNTILIANDLDSQTVTYIKKAFNVKEVYTKDQATFIKEDALDRSDIVLIIGFDLGNRLY